MRYKIMNTYTNECILESDNKKEIIKRLKELENKDYRDYLDYCQRCIDNYEDPTIDEIPGDYYCTYYIIDKLDNELYDIENYIVLERKEI